MPALEKNHIYRSTIEGYSSEGLGVARIDGQVVFVHDAVRGCLLYTSPSPRDRG